MMAVLALAACSTLATSPAATVKDAFVALQSGNTDGFEAAFGPDPALSPGFCSGSVVQCVSRMYASGGVLYSTDAVLLSRTGGAADVELRTSWSGSRLPRCQVFKLVQYEEGWRITTFLPPQDCPPEQGGE